MVSCLPPLQLFSCGVPQGSIGGPLLWLFFTCDQHDAIHEHNVVGQDLHRGCNTGPGDEQVPGGQGDCGDMIGYVDDGAYSYAHSDPTTLSEVLTRKFKLLEEWINGNRLVINSDKTHLMVLGPKKISHRRRKKYASKLALILSNQQKLRNSLEVTYTRQCSGTTTSGTTASP